MYVVILYGNWIVTRWLIIEQWRLLRGYNTVSSRVVLRGDHGPLNSTEEGACRRLCSTGVLASPASATPMPVPIDHVPCLYGVGRDDIPHMTHVTVASISNDEIPLQAHRLLQFSTDRGKQRKWRSFLCCPRRCRCRYLFLMSHCP